MFDNIGELEKQVEEFQQNILASNNLINALGEITATIKAHQNSLTEESTKLLDTLQSQISFFDTTSSQLLSSLEKNNDSNNNKLVASIGDLEKSITDEISHLQKQGQSTIDNAVKTLSSTNEQCLTNISNEFNHNHEEYVQKLMQFSKAVEEMKSELEQKYGAFIKELHETNLDQVSKDVQSLKKEVNSKFTLAYIGIVISVIASILSIVLR